jgi:hypothetical protein
MDPNNLRRAVLDLMLAEAPIVLVSFLTAGATLPGHLMTEPVCSLDVGLDMPRPIHHLELQVVEGLKGLFSFGGQYQPVVVPWDNMLAYTACAADKARLDGCAIAWPVAPERLHPPKPEPDPEPAPKRGLKLVS